jgi:hypothetical protein
MAYEQIFQQAVIDADPHLSRIYGGLRAWHNRLRVQQSARWLPRGLAAGLAAAALTAGAARIWPLMSRGALIRLSALLAGIGVVVTLALVWLWQRPMLALARRFDLLFGLRERLSTAVEIVEGGLRVESDALAAAQRARAAGSIDGVDARRALPIRLDWRDWALPVVALGALVAAIALPNPQEAVLEEQAALEQAMLEQLMMLEELRDEALADESLTEAERTVVVDRLDEAIETLSQDDITREEAMAALDAAEQELRDLGQTSAEARQEALQGAAGQFSSAGLEDVGQALAEGDFAEAGETLTNSLDDLSADELDSLADALEASNPELAESLRDAAEALREGDQAAAQAALDEAAKQMAEMGEGGETQLGELADQLREAQGEVAQPGEGEQGAQGAQGMGQAQPVEGTNADEGSEQGGTGSGEGQQEGPAGGQQAGDRVEQSDAAADGGEDEAEIYAPQRIGGEGGPEVDTPGDPESGVALSEGEMAENPEGEAAVPYSEVYGDYEASVNEALDSGYVPLGMRRLVQQYFSRLDPEETP